MVDREEVIGYAGFIQFLAGLWLLFGCAGLIAAIPDYPLFSLVIGLRVWVSKSCLPQLMAFRSLEIFCFTPDADFS